ncbi:Spx/MgsR family RNA polymerase-binding regulatory protein [Peptoniphilus sp. KCTC 25270]|uniref:Spx/MgsR family RNA polymerase-binding regulatory protein n=1 Tax=Peptoniphilus sp. KCTC 25270 TaxID=2897414 RepID=UPI001E64FC24|nr:Spx/MgsR family RNA polymerase-binding regulatory protein [Peptoniphilus sp. KCTC 25270]MCD1147446.1 Spx/MgsR family RNA polymerase-binding regulatory protein [Peptoniphilus sp. KCTC 25270]
MILIGYKKCSTCRKTEKFLEEAGVEFVYREIDKDNPSVEELKKWHEISGLDIKKFFNTSGIIYREKKLKDKLPNLSLEEKYELLATDGKLVKRPILLDGEKIYVGKDAVNFAEETT